MASMKNGKSTPRIVSPFYSRTYGGYTRQQIEFIKDVVGCVKGKTILDPMAGQAFVISTWPFEGANVWIGDIDPSMLFLASMRKPSIIANRHDFADSLKKKLTKVNRKKRNCNSLRYFDSWIASSIAKDLSDLASLMEIGLFANPYDYSPEFWDDNDLTIFEIGIVLLAARELTCYRTTDNRTWLRPGGRMKEIRIRPAILRALEKWLAFAEGVAEDHADNLRPGRFNAQRMNAAAGEFSSAPRPTTIVTSPPYANRLEYTKMWGPETEVLAAICSKSTDQIRRNQIGTTLVKEQSLRDLGLANLPKKTKKVLEKIRTDTAKYSESYYYPFFQMYAQSMASATRHMAEKLRKKGKLIVIVRDTVRKDQLFSTSEMVSEIVQREYGFSEIECTQKIVKGHVGQLRKNSVSGVYGLAQQEWWLSFRKD